MAPTAESTDIIEQHIAQFNIKIDGAQSPAELMDDVLEIMVENSLHLPDVCTLRIHDQQFKWLDSPQFVEGKRVQVEANEGTNSLKPLFDGEIVGLEMDLAGDGVCTVTVRCLDKSHRLHRGRKSRTFAQMKDSDIVSKVAAEIGLQYNGEATNVKHDWVLQNNQTNWEFLQERAAKNGHRIYVKGEKELVFEKVKDSGHSVIELEWGKELRSFRPRTSASGQVDEVEVRGWDPKTKKSIVEKVNKPKGIPQTGKSANGGEVSKKAFGASKITIVDRPIHSHEEAKALAQSLHDEIGGSFLEAEGLCFAVPDLKPGCVVKIKNIGTRFSGEYQVSSTTHSFTSTEGFTTQFVVSGKHPHHLLAAVAQGGGGATAESSSVASKSSVGGNIVVAIVTDNKDPDELGRVKVMYPWLTEEHASYWARQSSQMAGKDRGFFNIPEVGDEVLVGFEHGEVTRPFVLGQLWNGKDKPPKPSGNAMLGGGSEVNRRGYFTRVGHKLVFDDTSGDKGIEIETSDSHKMVFLDEKKKIEITSKDGHRVLIDDKDQRILIKTTGGHEVEMDDKNRKITLKDSGGDTIIMDSNSMKISMKATNEITMEATKISINAKAEFSAEAPKSTVKGTAQLDLESTGMTDLKGSKVTVQGNGMIDITAPMVKINS